MREGRKGACSSAIALAQFQQKTAKKRANKISTRRQKKKLKRNTSVSKIRRIMFILSQKICPTPNKVN